MKATQAENIDTNLGLYEIPPIENRHSTGEIPPWMFTTQKKAPTQNCSW